MGWNDGSIGNEPWLVTYGQGQWTTSLRSQDFVDIVTWHLILGVSSLNISRSLQQSSFFWTIVFARLIFCLTIYLNLEANPMKFSRLLSLSSFFRINDIVILVFCTTFYLILQGNLTDISRSLQQLSFSWIDGFVRLGFSLTFYLKFEAAGMKKLRSPQQPIVIWANHFVILNFWPFMNLIHRRRLGYLVFMYMYNVGVYDMDRVLAGFIFTLGLILMTIDYRHVLKSWRRRYRSDLISHWV